MRQLISFNINFEVEEEAAPPLPALLAELEMALRAVDGVDGIAADVAASRRLYTLVCEVEGHDPDHQAIAWEMEAACRRIVRRFAREPWCSTPLVLEEEDE